MRLQEAFCLEDVGNEERDCAWGMTRKLGTENREAEVFESKKSSTLVYGNITPLICIFKPNAFSDLSF